MSEDSPSEHILTDTAEGVCTITFNRPAKKNALTVQMYRDVVTGLRAADADPDTRVIVLRGAGDAFTSGNDLKDFRDTPPAGEDSPVFELLLTLADLDKPLVAAVRGAAIGIGVTGLLHCDLVYAADDAKFVLPFVNLGLVPEGASSLLLPRIAGFARAGELLLQGDPFDAKTAYDCGLVSQVYSKYAFEEQVTERVRALADKPAAALRATKRLIRDPLRDRIRDALGREGTVFLDRLTSPEAIEAFTAFLEKRKPDFRQFA